MISHATITSGSICGDPVDEYCQPHPDPLSYLEARLEQLREAYQEKNIECSELQVAEHHWQQRLGELQHLLAEAERRANCYQRAYLDELDCRQQLQLEILVLRQADSQSIPLFRRALRTFCGWLNRLA